MPIRRDLYLDDVPRVGTELRERKKLDEASARKTAEQEALEGVRGRERRASMREKSDMDIEAARRKVGLSVREDMIRRGRGLPLKTREPGVGRSLQARAGGYKDIGQVPTEGPGGVPLKGARLDPYTGTYLPTYEREPIPDEIRKERGYAEIASEKKMAEGKRRAMYPTNFERLGDALTSRVTSFLGGRKQAAAEPDYESMGEDALYALAQKGDRRAVEAGKRRFGTP
ncbi:MAG: hypothetical protein MOGMAGMI_02339 [Candidatus Omnitrophica bacterium]|nr:hypothetical protein [Candidatus Omnitrophota bacterium]